MSVTKQCCADALRCYDEEMAKATGKRCATAPGAEPEHALTLQQCCNELEKSGSTFGEIFAKAMAIFGILRDPNMNFSQMVTAIFALFNKTPPATLVPA